VTYTVLKALGEMKKCA